MNIPLKSNTSIDNKQAVHIVIPARYKSSRLPGKPLLTIHGKPMILWVAQKAKLAHFADDLCIATDDERIAKVCSDAGFEVVMTQSNHESGTDRLAEVAKIKQWSNNDIVINMQGDEPLVPAKLLNQVKDLLVDNPDCVMSTLYEPITTYREFVKSSIVKVVTDKHKRALYFSRAPIPCDRDHILKLDNALIENSSEGINSSGSTSNTYIPQHAKRHLGLYAYKVELLQNFAHWPKSTLESIECLEQLRVLENGGMIAIEEALLSLPAGVDTQMDLDRLNAMPISYFKNF